MRAALILSSIALLTGCNLSAGSKENQASGKQGERSFQVAGFDRVSLSGSPDVVVAVGGAPSVRAEGDSGVIDRLDIRVENGALEIGFKKDGGNFFSSSGRTTIYVTMPSIRGAAIGGSGDIRIDKVEGETFSGAIGGSGDMNIASLRVSEAKFSIGGQGGITVAGTAGKTDMSVAGSGAIDASGLESRTASVSVAGSGEVRAKATETADVSVAGSGDVHLDGTARCKVSKVGSGQVHCSNPA